MRCCATSGGDPAKMYEAEWAGADRKAGIVGRVYVNTRGWGRERQRRSGPVLVNTDYRHHYICMRCGHVRHFRPGVDGECPQCGSDSWRGLVYARPSRAPMVQWLDPDWSDVQADAGGRYGGYLSRKWSRWDCLRESERMKVFSALGTTVYIDPSHCDASTREGTCRRRSGPG